MKLVTGLPTGRCGHALRAFEDRTWAPYSWANSLRMLFVWSAFIRVPDKNLPPTLSHHPDPWLCLKRLAVGQLPRIIPCRTTPQLRARPACVRSRRKSGAVTSIVRHIS